MILLIIATIISCKNRYVPYLVSSALSITSKENENEQHLRLEIVELRRQLQTVSMVDQFPVYAKLQRRINSLTTQHQMKVSERQSSAQQTKFYLDLLFKVIFGFAKLWLIWNYNAVGVISLPSHLMWPLSYILALPFCRLGEVSIIVWMEIVSLASTKFSAMFKSSLVLSKS